MQTEITEEIEKLKGKRGEHKEGIQVFKLHAPCIQNRHSVCIAGVNVRHHMRGLAFEFDARGVWIDLFLLFTNVSQGIRGELRAHRDKIRDATKLREDLSGL